MTKVGGKGERDATVGRRRAKLGIEKSVWSASV
jgi:hypothetical protein